MERTILGPELKGGIWHKFFRTASKKDETLRYIIDEKFRFYKLYYPFLEKKQIFGKVYEELGIPHICGDVNRKELYKLFLEERRQQCSTSKNPHNSKSVNKRYPTLILENNSRTKNTFKRSILPLTRKPPKLKINKIDNNVEKSTNDITFDKLFHSNNNLKIVGKEQVVKNSQTKQLKSVRFNDGIEIHRVSPAQPLHKLKRIGRLFDEPSIIRNINMLQNGFQEADIFESDSEFDADTGIISDVEDSDTQDPLDSRTSLSKEQISQNQDVLANINVADLQETKKQNVKTIYECLEDEFCSTDSETAKNGNNLILSTKMITIAQGKWVRETEQIIGNNEESKTSELSKRKGVLREIKKDSEVVFNDSYIGEESGLDEQIIEKIKCLKISNLSQLEEISPERLCVFKHNYEVTIEQNEKDKLIRSLSIKQEIPNNSLRLKTSDIVNNESPEIVTSKESKISLDKSLNFNISNSINNELITVSSNKFSYTNGMTCNIDTSSENNSEFLSRNKPDKLQDNSNFINDWDSTNETRSDQSFLNYNSCHLKTELNGKELHNTDVIIKTNQQPDALHISEAKAIETITHEKCLTDDELYNVKREICKEVALHLSLGEEEYPEEGKERLEETDSFQMVIDTNKAEHICPIPDASDSLQCGGTCDLQEDSKKNIEVHSSDSITKIVNLEQPLTLLSALRDPSADDKSLEPQDSRYFDKSLKIKKETLEESLVTKRTAANNKSKSVLDEVSSKLVSLSKPIIIESQTLKGEHNFKSFSDSQENTSLNYEFHELFMDKKQKETSTDVIDISEIGQVEITNLKKKIMYIRDKNKDSLNKNKVLKINHEDIEKETNRKPEFSSITVMTMIVDKKYPGLSDVQKKMTVLDEEPFKHTIVDETAEKNVSDQELIDIYQGHFLIKNEPSGVNYLSKVQTWSIYPNDYINNLTIPSQSLSEIANCNTDLSEQEIENDEEENNKYYDHWSTVSKESFSSEQSKPSIKLEEELNIYESTSEKSWTTAESDGTIIPEINNNDNSDVVSTAYETDPETGKLRINHFLKPIANSTPNVKSKELNKINYFCENWEEYNLSGESSGHLNAKNDACKQEHEELDIEAKNELSQMSELQATMETGFKDNENEHCTSENQITRISPIFLYHNMDTGSKTKQPEECLSLNTNKKQNESEEKEANTLTTINEFKTSSTSNYSNNNVSEKKSTFYEINKNLSLNSKNYRANNNSDLNNYNKFHGEMLNVNLNDNSLLTVHREKKYEELNETSFKNAIENMDASTSSNKEDKTTLVISESVFNQQKETDKLNDKSTKEISCSKILNDQQTIELTNNIDHQVDPNKTSSESIIHDSDPTGFREVNINSNIPLTSRECVLNSQPDYIDKTSKKFARREKDKKTFTSKQNLGDSKWTDFTSSLSPSININFSKNEESCHSSNTNDENYEEQNCENNENLLNNDILKSTPRYLLEKSHITLLMKNSTSNESHKNITKKKYCDKNFHTKPELNKQVNIILTNDNPATNENVKLNTNDLVLKTISNSDSERQESQQLKQLMVSPYIETDVHENVQESQVVSSISSKIVMPNTYKTYKSQFISLKRNFKTICEIDSNNSLTSEDKNSQLKLSDTSFFSSNIQLTTNYNSETSIASNNNSRKINLKRVKNTDIRRKRAKLIKENPVKRGNTSSSEEDVKVSHPIKRKSLDMNILSVYSSSEPQIAIKKPMIFISETENKIMKHDNIKIYNNQEEDFVSKNLSSLTLCSENEPNQGNDITKETCEMKNKRNKSEETIEQTRNTLSYPVLKSEDLLLNNLNSAETSQKYIINPLDAEVNCTRSKSTNFKKLNTSTSPVLNNLNIGCPLIKKPLSDSLKKISVGSNTCDMDNIASEVNSNSMIEASPTKKQYQTISSIDVSPILGKSKSHKTYTIHRNNLKYYRKQDMNFTSEHKTATNEPDIKHNWMNELKPLQEKSKLLSNQFVSPCKGNEKSQNKDNQKSCLKNLRSRDFTNKGETNETPKSDRNPLKKLNTRGKRNKMDKENKKKKLARKEGDDTQQSKNVKSSIVRWFDSTDENIIGNSPEVKTLMRRTYYMGSN